jgi:hypothetical protein
MKARHSDPVAPSPRSAGPRRHAVPLAQTHQSRPAKKANRTVHCAQAALSLARIAAAYRRLASLLVGRRAGTSGEAAVASVIRDQQQLRRQRPASSPCGSESGSLAVWMRRQSRRCWSSTSPAAIPNSVTRCTPWRCARVSTVRRALRGSREPPRMAKQLSGVNDRWIQGGKRPRGPMGRGDLDPLRPGSSGLRRQHPGVSRRGDHA